MQLFVAKNGQQLGPFDEAQVRGMLTNGTISGEDLAWHSALPNWQPLATVLGGPASAAAPAPFQPAVAAAPVFSPAAGGTVLPPPGGMAGYGSPATITAVPANLASPGSRLAAVLLDCLFFSIAYLPGVIASVIEGQGRHNGSAGPLTVIGFGLSGLLVLALAVIQIIGISTRGQTLGKRIMGVRIVRMSGAPAGFVNGFLLRAFVGALPSVIPFLGFIYVIVDACFIFRADHRCIHDMIGDTCVVRA